MEFFVMRKILCVSLLIAAVGQPRTVIAAAPRFASRSGEEGGFLLNIVPQTYWYQDNAHVKNDNHSPLLHPLKPPAPPDSCDKKQGFDIEIVKAQHPPRQQTSDKVLEKEIDYSAPDPPSVVQATWRILPLKAKEIWFATKEAFGNFRFYPHARSRWSYGREKDFQIFSANGTSIVVQQNITVRTFPILEGTSSGVADNNKETDQQAGKKRKLFRSSRLFGEGAARGAGKKPVSTSERQHDLFPWSRHELVTVNMTFSLVKPSEDPTVSLKTSVEIPDQVGHSLKPTTSFSKQGTTAFVLNAAGRAIQFELDWKMLFPGSSSTIVKGNQHDKDVSSSSCANCMTKVKNPAKLSRPQLHRRIVGLGPQYSYSDLTDQGPIQLFSQEQGAGRGKEPITFFANSFYPFAGGDAFASYSTVPVWMDLDTGTPTTGEINSTTTSHAVLVTAKEYAMVDFKTTTSGKTSIGDWICDSKLHDNKNKFQDNTTTNGLTVGTSLSLVFMKDWVLNETSSTKVHEFETRLVLLPPMAASNSSNASGVVPPPRIMYSGTSTTPTEQLVLKINEQIADLYKKSYTTAEVSAPTIPKTQEKQTPSSSTAQEHKSARSSATTTSTLRPLFQPYQIPSWVSENGAILGLEGGMEKVERRLTKVYNSTPKPKIAAVWIQDWSGLVTTSFAKRVVWDWRLDESYYSGFKEFVEKWWNCCKIRVMTYVNPYLSATYSDMEQKTGRRTPSQGKNTIAETTLATGHQQRRVETESESRTLKNNHLPMFQEAKMLNYLVKVFNTSSYDPAASVSNRSIANETVILPSATDDFRFGLLDLAREEVRAWFTEKLLCNVMMTNIVPGTECYYKNQRKNPNGKNESTSTAPQLALVHGWMADFGEYLPFSYFKHDDGQNQDNSTSEKIVWSIADHHDYAEQWQLVNRMAIEKYESAKLLLGKELPPVVDVGKQHDKLLPARPNKLSTTSSTKTDIFPFFRSASLFTSEILNSHWMGDQMTTWDACDGFHSAVIGASNAGFSNWRNIHSDLGGYTMTDATSYKVPGTGDRIIIVPPIYRSNELLIRWMQYSAFAESAFRSHPGTKPNTSAQVYDDTILDSGLFQFYSNVFAAGAEYRRVVSEGGVQLLPVERINQENSSPSSQDHVNSSTRTTNALPLLRHGSLVVTGANGNGDIWWEKLDEEKNRTGDHAEASNTKTASNAVLASETMSTTVDKEKPPPASEVAVEPATSTSTSTFPWPPFPFLRDDCMSGKGTLVGENQFFVGPELLIAPVFQARQFTKKVYLPSGMKISKRTMSKNKNVTTTRTSTIPWKWQQLFTNDTFTGEDDFVTVKAPLEYIPVFYRIDENARFKEVLEAAYGNLTIGNLTGRRGRGELEKIADLLLRQDDLKAKSWNLKRNDLQIPVSRGERTSIGGGLPGNNVDFDKRKTEEEIFA
ncbi:unnamed protein product [Amoebophrya sp. A120]|nr:unnamed protein product [Amoebophrya sp. A120]|eukprot:GSA120T00024493001.1